MLESLYTGTSAQNPSGVLVNKCDDECAMGLMFLSHFMPARWATGRKQQTATLRYHACLFT